jgi:hypothetical protein
MPAPPRQSTQIIRVGPQRVATVRADGSIAIWSTDPATWVHQLCGLVGNLDNGRAAEYFGDVDVAPAC